MSGPGQCSPMLTSHCKLDAPAHDVDPNGWYERRGGKQTNAMFTCGAAWIPSANETAYVEEVEINRHAGARTELAVPGGMFAYLHSSASTRRRPA